MALRQTIRTLILAVMAIGIHLHAQAQVNLLTQGFETLPFPPAGWSNVRMTGPTLPGNWSRIMNGIYPVQTPKTGAYQMRYNSHNFLAGTSGEMRTSILNFTTEGTYTVSFWMYRDNWVAADKLEVFVNTAQTSVGGTLLGTINRDRAQSPAVPANGWYQYTFTIPGSFNTSTNYIIFKATSAFGNDIYVDDISVDRLAPAAPGCVAGFAPASGTTGTCVNQSITWDIVPLASGYKLTMGSNAPDYNNVANNIDLGVALSYSTFLSPSTNYNWKITPYNVYGEAIGCAFNNFTTGTSTCYCIPVYLDGSCGSEDFIDDFSTTGGATNITNNNSGCTTAPNNYNFFSAQTVTAQQGNSFNVSMQCGTEFAEGFAIWIDWNIDGDFADAGEYVFNSGVATLSVVNGTVTVPFTAVPGTTRMRVRCAYNYVPTAETFCTTFSEGETEDYNMVVTPCPAVTYFADADGDTFGNPAAAVSSCTGAPAGYVLNNTDCNDASAVSYPGSTEVCNSLDDDCDGLTDEGLTFLNYYADADGDGFGSNIATPVNACAAPVGFVLNNTDCNDANASVKPGAPEVCNTLDDDCDGSTDEGIPVTTYYADADGDTFGNNAVNTTTCGAAPAGYVANNTDCNDANAAIRPGATEICNSLDDDCDVTVDEGVIIASISAGGPTTFCRGLNVVLSANTGAGFTYQWLRNGANIAGATNSSFTASQSGNYTVRVTIPGGCFNVSPSTVVTVLASPSATITATMGTDLCGFASLELRANNGVGFSWQWIRNGGDVAGATSRFYYPTLTGNYRVRVTNASGCSKTSSTTVITKTCREGSAMDATLQLFPNPAGDRVMLQLDGLDAGLAAADCRIFDALGRIVYTGQFALASGSLAESLDVHDWAPGMYQVQLIAGDAILTGQLMVTR